MSSESPGTFSNPLFLNHTQKSTESVGMELAHTDTQHTHTTPRAPLVVAVVVVAKLGGRP
jgi:hypothetical protein